MAKTFLVDSLDGSTRMHLDGVSKYSFYHKDSHPANEPLLYKQIIQSATSKIEIFDPYFNVTGGNRDCDIFDIINNNITIKILSKKGLTKNPTYLTDIQNALKIKINAIQMVRFGVRVINPGDTSHANWIFHDRFLIIDDSDVYLIGGSIGYHIKADTSTGIYKIENSETIYFIKSIYLEYWKIAATYEIPVQYLHT